MLLLTVTRFLHILTPTSLTSSLVAKSFKSALVMNLLISSLVAKSFKSALVMNLLMSSLVAKSFKSALVINLLISSLVAKSLINSLISSMLAMVFLSCFDSGPLPGSWTIYPFYKSDWEFNSEKNEYFIATNN
eukprot:NODE_929_length_3035_cov_0.464918.p4 type:complete len:133 gc:universal NODE_929_length_3035_cov_0.464918:3003-2605(-)